MPSNLNLPDKLTRLLAFHENAAAAIRTTIALYTNAVDVPRESRRVATTLRQAVALDEERRALLSTNGTRPTKRKPGRPRLRPEQARYYSTAARKRRQRSADYLALFDATTPALHPGGKKMGLGSLVRRGYLLKRGDGYVRSAKPYYVDPARDAE